MSFCKFRFLICFNIIFRRVCTYGCIALECSSVYFNIFIFCLCLWGRGERKIGWSLFHPQQYTPQLYGVAVTWLWSSHLFQFCTPCDQDFSPSLWQTVVFDLLLQFPCTSWLGCVCRLIVYEKLLVICEAWRTGWILTLTGKAIQNVCAE